MSRAAHTYRGERRNIAREDRTLRLWRLMPLRVWRQGVKQETRAFSRPWVIFVRAMPQRQVPQAAA